MSNTADKTQPKDVQVKLLLAGGHQYTLKLKSDMPLLLNLLKAVIGQADSNNTENKLFQIPLNEGKSALCFSSHHLVGLETEPPIYLQAQDPPSTKPASLVKTYATLTALESKFAQIDHFLTPEEHASLLEYTFNRKADFVPTTTSTNAENYRRSMVLHHFPEFSSLIVAKVKAILPDILEKLDLPAFAVADVEAQLTMHNDGNFYKVHNDNGSPDTATRFFTYVYYFNREPKVFSGGELVIYDSLIKNNYYVKGETFKTVEPRNNSVVFFLSRYMHEVLPVHCPSKDFQDSRFTINGWVRRAN